MTAGQGAEGAEGRLLADVIAAEQAAGQQPAWTPTKNGWQAAALRWESAQAAEQAARQLWRTASEEVKAAETALADQEAAPGVPAWQHLLTAPRAEQCRLKNCRYHLPLEAPF